MTTPIQAALIFLVTAVFNIYLFILVIRLILVWVKADYFNPAVQFISKLTNFVIIPLRRFIPNIGRLETSTLLLMILIELIKFTLICVISFGYVSIFGLLTLTGADIIRLLLQTFTYAILVQAILSWIQPSSIMTRVLWQFTSPIMRPIHRLVPPINGIDISPIPALIILQLLIILIVDPATQYGWGMILMGI